MNLSQEGVGGKCVRQTKGKGRGDGDESHFGGVRRLPHIGGGIVRLSGNGYSMTDVGMDQEPRVRAALPKQGKTRWHTPC